MAEDDIFEAALNLEDTSYAKGYAQGVADGSRAGRIEGRIFGLEKGFEKFLEMGRLNGRASVWAARLKASSMTDSGSAANSVSEHDSMGLEKPTDEAANVSDIDISHANLLPLLSNPRLEKHVRSLLQLTDRMEISTANDEDSVADFDDRIKRARSKTKVIERLLGEASLSTISPGASSESRGAERGIRVVRAPRQPGTDRNIEDFGLKSTK
jgi:hypothetical protein